MESSPDKPPKMQRRLKILIAKLSVQSKYYKERPTVGKAPGAKPGAAGVKGRKITKQVDAPYEPLDRDYDELTGELIDLKKLMQDFLSMKDDKPELFKEEDKEEVQTALEALSYLNLFVTQFLQWQAKGPLKREAFTKVANNQGPRFITNSEVLPYVKAIKDWETLVSAYEKTLRMAQKEKKDAPATDEDKFDELKAKTEKVIDNIYNFVRPLADADIAADDKPNPQRFYTNKKAFGLAEAEDKTTEQIFSAIFSRTETLKNDFTMAKEKDAQAKEKNESIDSRIANFYKKLFKETTTLTSFEDIENQWKLAFNDLFTREKKQIQKLASPKEVKPKRKDDVLFQAYKLVLKALKKQQPGIADEDLLKQMVDTLLTPEMVNSLPKSEKEKVKNLISRANDATPGEPEIPEESGMSPPSPKVEEEHKEVAEEVLQSVEAQEFSDEGLSKIKGHLEEMSKVWLKELSSGNPTRLKSLKDSEWLPHLKNLWETYAEKDFDKLKSKLKLNLKPDNLDVLRQFFEQYPWDRELVLKPPQAQPSKPPPEVKPFDWSSLAQKDKPKKVKEQLAEALLAAIKTHIRNKHG